MRIHFAPYGNWKTTCGISVGRDNPEVVSSDRRKEVTCGDCQALMTDLGDLPEPVLV